MSEPMTQWARCCLVILVGVMAESVSALGCEFNSPAERALEKMFSLQGTSFEGTVLFERRATDSYDGRLAGREVRGNAADEPWSIRLSSSGRRQSIARTYL